MDFFTYRDGQLHAEEIPVGEIAREVRTPAYVYSKATLLDHYDKLARAFAAVDPLICYSVKANSNLSILRLMKERGAGFDVVSGGELFRTMKIEADPAKVVFAGVGKTDEEIRYALRKQIFLFNVESRPELQRIHQIAREMGLKARVTIRVNPDVDPQTHRYIATGKKETKFGIDFVQAAATLEGLEQLDAVELLGLHMHIGSQITETEPYRQATEKLVDFADAQRAKGRPIQVLNIGGGFGIFYKERTAKPAEEIAAVIVPPIRKRGFRVLLEPGRFITGNAGILLTKVIFVKESGEKRFVICDAGMNDL
ncbi:MAG TPA: diaminopimelate decarboxylase, partial [Planctomycetota bacterium]|nr:diaminopimelate decarboxylase [Planctomycetota bacterium]